MGAAQSVQVVPQALRHIPTTGAIYWQQLQVTLDHADAASDNAIIVQLPHGVLVHDADGDGAVYDEIRAVYVGAAEAPGYSASIASTTDRVVVRSQGAADAGDTIYLQFPILVSVPPVGTVTRYKAVLFADDGERDLVDESELPALSFVGPGELDVLGSMDIVTFAPALSDGADTAATSAVGTTYPDSGEAVLLSLPDLVFDGGLGDPNRSPGWGDGDDANDTEYTFYFSPEASLDVIGASAIPARTADGELLVLHEGPGGDFQLLTRDLPAGTYYLYVRAAVTGNIPVGRSGPIRVRHEPGIETFGQLGKPLTIDSGGLYDEDAVPNGRGTGRLKMPLSIVDHDDDAIVHLFYSGNPNFSLSDIITTGSHVELGSAGSASGAAGLAEDSRSFVWDTTHPELVPVGDYYLYAVAIGGKGQALARTDYPIAVRHAPFLRLDPLDDAAIAGPHSISTGGERPQRFVTFTWGRRGVDGDVDADDDARISLYYSDAADFEVPGGAEAIALAAADPDRDTHLIGTRWEDPDTRQENQLVWDLWSLADSARAGPVAGVDYHVYGVIADSTDSRLVQMDTGGYGDSGGAITFIHAPTIRPVQPLSDIQIPSGHSGRASWEDMDLDDDARIRVILSAEDHGYLATYDVVTERTSFVVNSADGRALAEVDVERDLSEDSPVDYLDVRWDHLKRGMSSDAPASAGDYYVYLAIEDGPAFGPATPTWQARGKIQLTAPDDAASPRVFSLYPEVFTMGTGGARQRLDLLVDAAENPVDQARVTLAVDGSRFQVADQDSTREGTQPFAVASGLSDAKLATNAADVSADGSLALRLEYFDPTALDITHLGAGQPLVSFELIALELGGPSTIDLAGDAEGDALAWLELRGDVVAASEAGPLSTGHLLPGRAIVRGRLVLEGRGDNTASVDLSFRRWAEYSPLDDSLFAAANDADPAREGVQVTLDSQGSFELLEVPTGRLDLYAHLDGYLDAWHRDLDLVPGEVDTTARPTTGDSPTDSLMLGGDVAGYTDAGGECRPDNQVTLADWDYVASLFDRVLTSADDSVRADITGDGIVGIGDLSLVGWNFLYRGPQPVYKALPAPPGEIAMTAGEGERHGVVAGDVVSVLATAGPLTGVRSFEIDLRFGEDQWQLLETRFAREDALLAHRDHSWGVRVAAVLPGRDGDFSEVAGAEGGALTPVVTWRLLARVADPDQPRLSRAVALGQGGSQLPVRLLENTPSRHDPGPPLPNHLALEQNFPNPFNPETTLAFSLPPLWATAESLPAGSAAATSGVYSVRLEVYNGLGQRVAVVARGDMSPGHHQVAWNGLDTSGSPVASGVYLYRLTASTGGVWRQVVRRMLLLR